MMGRIRALATRVAAAAALVATGLMAAGDVRAEVGWVKDELRLNLRSGPGTQYRIMGVVKTGDSAEILARGEGWTKVRLPGLDEGWIPAGYLQPEEPARVQLSQREGEVAELREQVDRATKDASELRTRNESISGRDEQQRSEIGQLTRENLELRAGARWPEWITGAGLLVAGMMMGAILHRINSSRQRGPRIRL